MAFIPGSVQSHRLLLNLGTATRNRPPRREERRRETVNESRVLGFHRLFGLLRSPSEFGSGTTGEGDGQQRQDLDPLVGGRKKTAFWVHLPSPNFHRSLKTTFLAPCGILTLCWTFPSLTRSPVRVLKASPPELSVHSILNSLLSLLHFTFSFLLSCWISPHRLTDHKSLFLFYSNWHV